MLFEMPRLSRRLAMKLGLCLCLVAAARSEVVGNNVGALGQLNNRDVASAFVELTSRRELNGVNEDPYLRGSKNGRMKGPPVHVLAKTPEGASLVPKVAKGGKKSTSGNTKGGKKSKVGKKQKSKSKNGGKLQRPEDYSPTHTPESAAPNSSNDIGTRPPIPMTTPAPSAPSPGSPTATLTPTVSRPVPAVAQRAAAPTGLVSPAPTPAQVVLTALPPIDFSTRPAIVPKVLKPLVAIKSAESEVAIVSRPLNVPAIKWEVHVDPVLLKAHTSFNLEEKEPEIFGIVSQLLTPYLQRLMGAPLLAYTLQVAYGESYPEENNPGIIVTHFEVTVILQYLSDSIESYRTPVQEVASDNLHRFFEGSERYQLLGDLRNAGIEVTEIVLEDEDFRSPIFDGVTITQVQGPGSSKNSSSSNNEKDKTGLFAAIGAGSFVLVAIMSVAYKSKKRQRITQLRLGDSYSGSQSTRSNRSSSSEEQQVVSGLSEAKRQLFSGEVGRLGRKGKDRNETPSSNSGSRSGSAELRVGSHEPEQKRRRWIFFKTGNDKPEEPKTRQRSYSGSFRRFPAGSISPAAIQTEPAFSKDYLKSVSSGLEPPAIPTKSFDDQSYSVAGDYNVPTEYDVKASPLPSVYGGGRHSNNDAVRANVQQDEFSMPDQYSVAPSMMNDEFSMPNQSVKGFERRPYSKSMSPEHPFGRSPSESESPIVSSPWGLKSVPNDYPLLLMDGQDSVESPMSDVLMDEWSVDSFTTQQTTQTSRKNRVSPTKAGWTKPKKGSARKQQQERRDASDLNMPSLV